MFYRKSTYFSYIHYQVCVSYSKIFWIHKSNSFYSYEACNQKQKNLKNHSIIKLLFDSDITTLMSKCKQEEIYRVAQK